MSSLRIIHLAAIALLTFCASCRAVANSFRDDPIRTVTTEYALEQLAFARNAASSGNRSEAVEALLELRNSDGLDSALRGEIEVELERTTYQLVEELRERGADGEDELDDLYDEEFPRRLKARIGVSTARALLAGGERLKAFKNLKQLDLDDPTHSERYEASELLAEVGFSFSNDTGRYFFGLSEYRSLAPQVLEYLVLNYPTSAHCPDAYAHLAQLYADNDDWEYAVARLEDLVLYHPESRHVDRAALMIPEYRMNLIVRDGFDRGNLLVARSEIDEWRARFPEHELWPESESIRNKCLTRLAKSDLGIARFYRRIERATGARLHAERAIQEAMDAGNAELLREAEALWSSIANLSDDESHQGLIEDPLTVDPFEGETRPDVAAPIP